MIVVDSRKNRLHDWLRSERPQSRRQASLVRAYGAWRSFARNRLAMLGLLLVLALMLVAALADWLAPYSPYVGDLLSTRLLPPSATGGSWCAPHRLRRSLHLAQRFCCFSISSFFWACEMASRFRTRNSRMKLWPTTAAVSPL